MVDQVAHYLARYRSATPEQRRDAVIKLGKSGDKRAIPLLQQMVSTEPDPHLHDLILKAIQHLQSQASSANAPPAPPLPAAPKPTASSSTVGPFLSSYDQPLSDSAPSSSSSYTRAETESLPSEPAKRVSDREKQLAKSRLDYALSLHIAKQNDKAMLILAEAVRADPSILDTQMARNLAMALTGEPDGRALEIIRAKSQDPAVAGQAARPEFSASFAAELFNTAIEVLALVVVFVLIGAVLEYGVVQGWNRFTGESGALLSQLNASQPNQVATLMTSFSQGFAQGVGSRGNNPMAQATLAAASPAMATLAAEFQSDQSDPALRATEIAQMQSGLSQLTLPVPPAKTVLSDSLSFGLRLLASILLSVLAIYIIGTLIGGTGGVLRFVRYMTRAYLAIFGTILLCLGILFAIVTRIDVASNTWTTLVGSVGALTCIMLLALLIGMGVVVFAASRGHQFGLFKGFVAVVVGTFVLGLLSTLLGVGRAVGL